MELVRKIQKVTELECGDISASHSMLSLIIQHASDGQLDCHNNRGLHVVRSFENIIIIAGICLFFCIEIELFVALQSSRDLLLEAKGDIFAHLILK